jgi:hypothetical protein
MDDEMAQCYLTRYSDVIASGDSTPEEAAKNHWFRWGFFEGRHPYCAKPITSYQARCYLNRYPDLQQAFKMDIEKARNHWYQFGSKENRNPLCASEGPKYCGENGEMCACHGTVHLARWQSSSLQSSAKSSTWEQAAGFLVQHKHVGKELRCDSFGNEWRAQTDIFDHQCFCEEKPPKEVFKCGNENEKCECNGINVFARKTSNNGTEIPFEEAFELGNFEFQHSNNGEQCTTAAFNAHGFAEGI